MKDDRIAFRVTELDAAAPQGVLIQWQGRELNSGRLRIELDEEAPAGSSCGTLDYLARRAEAAFHIKLSFPELAGMLEELGVDPALTRPVRAVLRSQGAILEDHGFALSGRSEPLRHELLGGSSAAAAVLPGH